MEDKNYFDYIGYGIVLIIIVLWFFFNYLYKRKKDKIKRKKDELKKIEDLKLARLKKEIRLKVLEKVFIFPDLIIKLKTRTERDAVILEFNDSEEFYEIKDEVIYWCLSFSLNKKKWETLEFMLGDGLIPFHKNSHIIKFEAHPFTKIELADYKKSPVLYHNEKVNGIEYYPDWLKKLIAQYERLK